MKIDFFRFSALGVSGSDLSFLAGEPKLSEARFRFSFPFSADWKVIGFEYAPDFDRSLNFQS